MRLTGCVVALLGGIHKQVCVALNDKLTFGGGVGICDAMNCSILIPRVGAIKLVRGQSTALSTAAGIYQWTGVYQDQEWQGVVIPIGTILKAATGDTICVRLNSAVTP